MRSNSINRFAVSSAARAPSDEAFENSPNLASSSCPSKENSCFKDTISMNKSGTSDLSLEPQQMKRKKRGGKNNLRKSLAWDRAFFTEEGVLDPLELSAISGVSCRGGLSLINEDTPVISGQDEDFHKDKENDLPLPKLNLSSSNRVTSSSLLSHKVPLNAGSKLGSKCGDCPRPSPSLKRRVNANVGKATGTVLKLPKVTGLKPGLSPTCAANKRTILRRSHAKHDDITQPDFSIPTDVKLDSSFKSHRNVQNTSRATASLSASHSDGDLGNSSFNRHLSINMIPMTVDKDDSVSNTASVNVTKISQERSCDGQRYDSVPITTLYSQNAHNNGRTLRHLQNQTVRPSGLRMPSPSLSFFSQPKPSALWNMPLRNTSSDVYGSQNCGSSTLLDNLSRTTKYYDKIPDSRISSSKDKCYGSESTASTHASVIDLVKSRLDQKLIYESRALPTKNVIVRTSHEDSEVQNIATEISSQNGSQELTMNKFLKNAIDICHVKNESHERERRIAELVSKQNDSIPESQTVHEIDEQPEKNKTLNLLVLNNDSASTQGTDGFDYKVQNTSAMDSDWRKSSDKPDFHEVHLEKTDPLKYALGENEEGTAKNISEESATEQLVVYQQRGYCCNKSMKPSEQGEVVAESTYFESKNLQHPLKVLTDNLPAAGAPMHKFSFASIVEGYENESKMSEVGDDIKQPSQSPEPQNFHQEVAMESRQVGKLNKRSSLPNLQQEENADELLIIAADRKDGDNMIDSRLSFSVSLGKRHKSNLSEERSITQLPRKMVGCDSVGNSFSSGNCNSSVNNSFDSDVDTSNGNWSDGVCQDNRSREIIDDSSLPESTIHPFSPQDTLIKEAEELPCIEVGSVDNLNVHTKTLPVQPLGSNMLNNCFFQKSERMALTDDKFVAENLVHSNDFMEAKNLLDVSSEDAFGGLNISVTNEVFQSNSRSSTPAKESPLTHEIFSEEYEIWDGIGVENAVTDPSRVEAFSDSIKVRVSEDNDRVETTDISNNDPVDGLDEKKHPSVVIPPNAAPFSDEWLAAIEAAGEDILTRKGGAVQNSPPDKSVPEPSPWSPVIYFSYKILYSKTVFHLLFQISNCLIYFIVFILV